jgi:hypothetical protein
MLLHLGIETKTLFSEENRASREIHWRLCFLNKNQYQCESVSGLLQRLERHFDGHAPAHARIDIVYADAHGV